MVGFDSVKIKGRDVKKNYNVEEVSKKEIAIIGIALKLPKANSIEDFWEVLKDGIDCVGDIPEGRRQDILDALRLNGIPQDRIDNSKAAFLDEIDKFDYNYFKLSPKESSLMDPNQRLFLQTAWEAMEDAGYGAGKLKGSRTGVYVGFSSDSEYRNLVSLTEQNYLSMALPGNVKPVVASRISYLMDFRGPSMIVDTACSSSLVAVHLAMKAIQNDECDIAIVGGAQLHLLPVRHAEIGVEASDGRAKTFDDQSDGTGTGEGVIAMLIKPLWKAMKDHDRIYAVIEGSAVNQDGNSNGLTTPNVIAQEDVIIRAWEKAGISPETVTYIEAHGTGTKLGDPIEIEGIQRAFGRYTDRKQFCAIGAVKTNIGHLDNTAGIAGLLKAVLCLENKQLVPSLHFKKPNSRISFENSPVYVSSRLADWVTDGNPRRCGVSAFGLSGTNCHIVLREAPEIEEIKETCEDSLHVLTLSAKNQIVLKNLIDSYKKFLKNSENITLEDICFTANTRREHYSDRLAIIFKNKKDLELKLNKIDLDKYKSIEKQEGIYYNSQNDMQEESQECTNSERQMKSMDIDSKIDEFVEKCKQNYQELEYICEEYIKGTEINWNRMYTEQKRRIVRLPTYPFEAKRCWINAQGQKTNINNNQNISTTGKPLLDRCITETPWIDIYATDFNIEKHWVLNEHKIDGNCVLVGTTHLEMVMEGCSKHFPEGVCFDTVQFLTPLFVQPEEVVHTQLLLRRDGEGFEFYVASRSDNRAGAAWVKHVEGRISSLKLKATEFADIAAIKNRCGSSYIIPDMEAYNTMTSFEFGLRWKNIKEVYIGQTELISTLEMPQEFQSELNDYPLHPAMLDNALATIPLLNKTLNILPGGKESNNIFLPFSYSDFNVFGALPEKFFSHVKMHGKVDEKSEIISFSIDFIDPSGNIFANIGDYSIKKVRKSKLDIQKNDNIFYQTHWIPSSAVPGLKTYEKGCALLLNSEDNICKEIGDMLNKDGWTTFNADNGSQYSSLSLNSFSIGNSQEEYDKLMEELSDKGITHIFHMLSLSDIGEPLSMEELEYRLDRGVNSLFRLCKAIMNRRMLGAISLVIIAKHANKVLQTREAINPENAAMFGLVKVLAKEYSNIRFKCLDIDDSTLPSTIYNEMLDLKDDYITLRNGKRYIEEFDILNIEELPDNKLQIRSGGVYLITGGLGGIGLEMCRYLASKAEVNIAIVGRSVIPNRDAWELISKEENNEKLIKKLEIIKEIEQVGSNVMYYSADVASETEISKVLCQVREKWGVINGIIHSAGIAGEGLALRKKESIFKQVLSPKVQGTWLLDHLTAKDKLDFLVLFSSNNTLEGMQGQSDYTSANSYLDAFSAYRTGIDKRTITINWPAWKETGMAFDYGVAVDGFMKAMSTTDALNAFEKVLNKDIGRVIIGELNSAGSEKGFAFSDMKLRMSDKIKKEIEKPINKTHTPHQNHVNNKEVEITLKGKPNGEYTETEMSVALIWGEVLGFNEFNVNESFFDIGGDSIMVTKVHEFIEKKYPNKVLMGDLFSYTSISKLANFISELPKDKESKEKKPKETQRQDKHVESDILAMFDEIEKGNLSMDNASELIAQMVKKK